MNKKIIYHTVIILCMSTVTACSALPEDIRASLPESMRGDVTALKDYPTPQLDGTWTDKDFPELNIALSQNGSNFSIRRTGSYQGVAVDTTYQGIAEGRSLKLTSSAKYSGKIRPVTGKCFGVAAKDSSSIQLTCEDSIRHTYPLNLTKQ